MDNGGGGKKQFDDELLEMFHSDRKEFEQHFRLVINKIYCLCTNIPKTQPTNFVGVLLKDKAAEQSANA